LGLIKKRIDENLAEDQFGFRGEAILCLRNIVEENCAVEKKHIYCLCRLTGSF